MCPNIKKCALIPKKIRKESILGCPEKTVKKNSSGKGVRKTTNYSYRCKSYHT